MSSLRTRILFNVKSIVRKLNKSIYHGSLQTKIKWQNNSLSLFCNSEFTSETHICGLGKMSLFTTAGYKGGFTVEAAAVLPLFLLFMLMFFVFFNVSEEQGSICSSFVFAAKEAAVLEHMKDEEKMITLQTVHMERPEICAYPGQTVFGHVLVKARAWTGRERLFDTDARSGQKMVYKTVSGTVYHTDIDCSYLNPSIQTLPRAQVQNRRNSSGEKYYSCDLCEGDHSDQVYITDYGNRYHSSVGCSGLKRNIMIISSEDAKDCPLCSKCAASKGVNGCG